MIDIYIPLPFAGHLKGRGRRWATVETMTKIPILLY